MDQSVAPLDDDNVVIGAALEKLLEGDYADEYTQLPRVPLPLRLGQPWLGVRP